MRGRDQFQIIRPLLRASIALLRVLPRGVSEILLACVRHVPTRIGIALRYVLVARLAKSCGDCVSIHEGVYLLHIDQMEFDGHVSIHPLCYLDGYGGLRIGLNVSIAHGCSILTSEHDFEVPGQTTRDAVVTRSPVTIGQDVWMGCGVKLLSGAHIGDGAVIGAGAVVTKDIPARSIAIGIPARVVKNIEKRAA